MGNTNEGGSGGHSPSSSYFACFGEGLRDLAVASAVAGRDEVGDAAALQEGGGGHLAVCAEEPGEGDHLHQAQANHRRLGVVAEAQAVTETGSHRHDVLQRKEEMLPVNAGPSLNVGCYALRNPNCLDEGAGP